MSQLITFATNHPFLIAAFIMICVLLVMNLMGDRLRGYQSVPPVQATQLINRDNAIIVDVREDNEFQQGHIVNSMHIPLGYFKDRIVELEKHRDKPIIVGCRSGHRSGHACALLKKAGFEQVFNLSGGVMAWQNANLPLTRK